MKRTSRNLSVGAIVLGAVVAAAPSAMAASHVVHPGDSIQAAVDAANPGDTIKLLPGDYTETHGNVVAVHVTKRLKLRGKRLPHGIVGVRLHAGPGNLQGIVVEPANEGDPDLVGIEISGIRVEGFPKNGIWLRHVQRYKIVGNESVGNLENGIWPTLSAKGLVKKNLSYGSEDSALWIEASENVRAIGNELHSSPTGLEVTISKNIEMIKNDIHDNSVGVGLYHPNAAGLTTPYPLDELGDWKLTKNHIHDNNAPNSAPPGSMSAQLPPGVGVFVLGVDRVTLLNNTIENNGFVGLGMLDWCLGVDCGTSPPTADPDTIPDHNTVALNTLTGNGLLPAPPGFESYAGFRSDILFVPTVSATPAVGDCFLKNTATVVIPLPLPTTCS
jgi:nitrous oxidase accessory protein NosD